MKKNKIIIIVIMLIAILTVTILLITANQSNLIELNYDEIIEKIDNKESFVLCISRIDCVHCQSYKPKLKQIANDYDITIYYINTDNVKKEKYEEFKNKLNFDESTPVTIFIKDGEEKTTATRIEGNASSRTIINKLKANDFIE